MVDQKQQQKKGVEVVQVKKGTYVQRASGVDPEKWTLERIDAIGRMITRDVPAQIHEIATFVQVADRYQLDPFLGEIWMAKDKGKIIILTGRDAILKVARRDSTYLGYRSGLVHENDEFALDVQQDGSIVLAHKVTGIKRGPLIGAYCVVYMEGRPPVWVIRELADYQHLSHKDNWKNYTPDMLETRVIAAAHRRAVNITALYTREEFVGGELEREGDGSERDLEGLRNRLAGNGAADQAPDEIEEAEFEVVEEETPDPDPDFDRLKGRYFALCGELGLDDGERHAWQREHMRAESASAFTADDFRRAIAMLEHGIGVPERQAAEPGWDAEGGYDDPPV